MNLKSHLLRSICLLVNFKYMLCKLKRQGVLNGVKFCISSNCSHQCPQYSGLSGDSVSVGAVDGIVSSSFSDGSGSLSLFSDVTTRTFDSMNLVDTISTEIQFLFSVSAAKGTEPMKIWVCVCVPHQWGEGEGEVGVT